MSGFFEACGQAREKIGGFTRPLLVHHYDCDGIAAAGIAARGLEKAGKKFSLLCLKKMGAEDARALAQRPEKEIIILDLGAGGLDELEKLDKEIVVIDHHQARQSRLLNANPHLFGFDGSFEACGSTAAYFVFGDAQNADLAVTGAVGDVQAPFKSLNRQAADEGVKAGVVEIGFDLRIYGRGSRNLASFLSYSVEPFLPGLTGERGRAEEFLEKIGISPQKKYAELAQEEKKKLVSALAEHLARRGASATAEEMFGEVFTLPRQEKFSDASEFSSLLNACGRHGKGDVGVRACMGQASAFEEAETLLQAHRNELKNGVEWARQNVVEFKRFYFFDGRGQVADGVVGIVANMLYTMLSRSKPIVGIALSDEGTVKASGRATGSLVKNGLNLGKALSEACAGIGQGGGHSVAAGANFKPEKLNEFLERFDEQLEKQVG